MEELNIIARKANIESNELDIHVHLELDYMDMLNILDEFKVEDVVKRIGAYDLLNHIGRERIENFLKQNYHDEY